MVSFVSSIRSLLQTKRLVTLIPGLLGAAKVITDAFGWHIITNPEINDITNGVAAVMTIISVVMSHERSSSGKSTSVSATGGSKGGSASSSGTSQSASASADAAVASDDPPQTVQPEAASDGFSRP